MIVRVGVVWDGGDTLSGEFVWARKGSGRGGAGVHHVSCCGKLHRSDCIHWFVNMEVGRYALSR